MKTIFTFLLFLVFQNLKPQSIIGEYSRLDSKIWIKSDSTFKYWYSVDTYRAWAKGVWRLKGKRRIIFEMIPIFDTVSVYKDSVLFKDSLILSKDERSDRQIPNLGRTVNLFHYEQNEKLYPKMLLYKKGRLYIIENGKRQKRKINNGYYIYPFFPWYTKQN